MAKSVPVDKPLLRSLELLADRRRGADGTSLGKLHAQAVAATSAMEPASETPTTPATPGGNTWVQLGPVAIPGGQSLGNQARVLVSGRVTAIQVDPLNSSVIYIGTARGGVWKTTDAGYTWRPTSDHYQSLAIGALSIAPSDSKVLYAGTGEGNVNYLNVSAPFDSIRDSYFGSGVLVSQNGGDSWAVTGQGQFTAAACYRIAIDPQNSAIAWAATSSGVFRTTNSGGAWSPVRQQLPAISASIIAATDVAIDPVDPNTVYVAFYGDAVYRTTNGADAAPAWARLPFDDAQGGTPSRIALAISPSSPNIVYALAGISIQIKNYYPIGAASLFVSNGSGFSTVKNLTLGGGFDTYCLSVDVDPTTPAIVYLSGLSLFKAIVDPYGLSGYSSDIGQNIHADHHAFAFDPTDSQIIYAGTDGGIFRSADGGQTWTDGLNAGMCITQFECIDQHPTSDALILGGTQDNGTEQYRNSSVFYHSDDGDGGCVAIDPQNPRIMIHEYYSASPVRSEFAGSSGSWNDVSNGIANDPSLFYPPFALNPAHPERIAFGTNALRLDAAQGTKGWGDPVLLPGLDQNNPNALVSAILYIDDDLIFVGTTQGQVFRIMAANGVWTPTAIHTADLPANWIWEIATLPDDTNTLFVAMAGYQGGHVWRGAVTIDGAGKASAKWSDISGNLPNSPVNCLLVDPKTPKMIYIGADTGVFRTLDWSLATGVTWEPFSDGLPNTAVYDLRLFSQPRLLRAATHGRGIWERKLDEVSAPDTQIYLRAHRMDTGRGALACAASEAAFDDGSNDVSLGDELWPWETPDLKVDALQGAPPAYQLSFVDDVAFETRLTHVDPVQGCTNRLYVQVHNRGKQMANGVSARVYYTETGPYLPDLPADFWTNFPAAPSSGAWRSLDPPPGLSILPTEPAVARLDAIMGDGDPQNCCFLIVADGENIPAANRVIDVQALVRQERRAALKNVLLVQANGNNCLYMIPLGARSTKKDQLEIRSLSIPGWAVGVLFPRGSSVTTDGFRSAQPSEFEWLKFRSEDLQNYDPATMSIVTDSASAIIHLPSADDTIPMYLALIPSIRWGSGRITLVRKVDGVAAGGSTILIRPAT